MGITLVVILGLLTFSVPESFAKETGKTKVKATKNTIQVTSTKAGLLSEKFEEADKKGEMKSSAPFVSPTDKSLKDDQPATEINPLKPQQTQDPSASAATGKGKQIKWQVVSSGANIGGTPITYQLGRTDGNEMSGTIGQVGVGSGSSPSFSMNSGFWQEFLQGYIRGDVNGDGVIDIADIVYLLNYLFFGGPEPAPLWVGDADCDGLVDIDDIVYLLNYLFISGPSPSC